jgi:hypothetical protein
MAIDTVMKNIKERVRDITKLIEDVKMLGKHYPHLKLMVREGGEYPVTFSSEHHHFQISIIPYRPPGFADSRIAWEWVIQIRTDGGYVPGPLTTDQKLHGLVLRPFIPHLARMITDFVASSSNTVEGLGNSAAGLIINGFQARQQEYLNRTNNQQKGQ